MNVSIAVLTLIVLVFGIYNQLKVWKVRAFLSPGFYFSFMWMLGVIGVLLFKSVGILNEAYPEYIDELNILVGYTSICFSILARKGRKKVSDNSISITNYINSFRLYKIVSLLYLIIAIYVFFVEGTGFDFASARNNMHETIENRSFLITYFRLISLPLSIFAGNRLMQVLLKYKKANLIQYVYLFLPFVSDTLFSLTEGGRVAMVYSMLMYVIGGVLLIPIKFDLKRNKNIIVLGVLIALSINFMISWVGSVRSENDSQNIEKELVKEKLGAFGVAFGAIEYMSASYIGYQYRRVDAISPQLGYGQYSLNGFINWQIPFAGRFGVSDASIAGALGIYYFNQETYDFHRDYYYVTHSAYLPLIKDFGFYGAFIAIFLLVLISHNLFVKIQLKPIYNYSTNFFFYYLFFIYWTKSNFYGTLSDTVLIPLYGFLIVDILNVLNKKKV